MRILFISHAWTPESRGGTEIHARDVALGLLRRGHQVGVFCRTSDPSMGEYEVRTATDEGLGVTRINNTFQHLPTFEWIYRNREIHEAFVRELDEFRPDLVHVHHISGLSSTIIEELKRRGVPTVMTLHDFWTVCPRGQRMRTTLEICEDVDRQACFKCLRGLWPHIFDQREVIPTVVDARGRLSPQMLAEFDRHMAYVLNLCDRLVTPSEFHRERMLDFPIDPARIIALPHGMRHDLVPENERAPRPPRRIGFIGSVIPVKGVHVLLAAFQQLTWPGLELHVHGEMPQFHEDKTYGERLKRLAGDRPDIHFHGAYQPDDLPRILDELDLLVVPSLWWETFCLTIREGLLAGVPVIASDIGAMREALDGERDGLLFKTGDPVDLARKIERFLGDEELRTDLAARRVAVKSLQTYLGQLENLYMETISIAAERAPDLVVAEPFFPELPAPPAEPHVPAPDWDAVKVSVRESNLKGLSFSSRLPDAERPVVGLEVAVRDGDRELGAVDLEVDLSALGLTLPASEAAGTQEREKPARRSRKKATTDAAQDSRQEPESPASEKPAPQAPAEAPTTEEASSTREQGRREDRPRDQRREGRGGEGRNRSRRREPDPRRAAERIPPAAPEPRRKPRSLEDARSEAERSQASERTAPVARGVRTRREEPRRTTGRKKETIRRAVVDVEKRTVRDRPATRRLDLKPGDAGSDAE